jgi:hypothetical protein
MGQYVMGIVGAAAVIGIMDAMIPQNGKTKGYMRLVAALCLLCLVVRPLGDVMESLPSLMGSVGELVDENGAESVLWRMFTKDDMADEADNEAGTYDSFLMNAADCACEDDDDEQPDAAL